MVIWEVKNAPEMGLNEFAPTKAAAMDIKRCAEIPRECEIVKRELPATREAICLAMNNWVVR